MQRASTRSQPLVIGEDGSQSLTERAVASECPVSLTYNGEPHAVMMATPADIEDFAIGFSLTERIVPSPGDIAAIIEDVTEAGLLVHLEIPVECSEALRSRQRTVPGQTACGLCGVQELEEAVRSYRRIERPPPLTSASIFAAMRDLPAQQTLNSETGAAHAAAFVTFNGCIEAVREDVGRHNALDKLIGHLARRSIRFDEGYILMTSRCSVELVQKVLSVGIPALVTVSAPTALAIELSESHRLTLVALARSDSVLCFNDPFDCFSG